MWSDVDEVLLNRGMVWGKPTARIPGNQSFAVL